MEVKSITINLGGKKEITLSLEDAKKLYKELGELFKEKTNINWIQREVPYVHWTYPLITCSDKIDIIPDTFTTCSVTVGG